MIDNGGAAAREVRGMSRRTLLRRGGAVAAAAVVAGTSGCRGLTLNTRTNDPNALSISWWAEGNLSKLHVDVLDTYAADHPGVTISPQYQPLKGYDDKLSTELAGRNEPDIFQLRRATFADYISRGAVRQLDDLVPGSLPFDTLPQQLQDAAKYKGHWYAIPLGLASSPALVADTVVLKQTGVDLPPTQWSLDDFEALLQKVRKNSGGKLFGAVDMAGNEYALTSFLAGAGKPLFTSDGRPGFDQKDLTDWYTLWNQWRSQQLVPPMSVTAAGTGFTTDPLVKGLAAITLAASSKGINGYQPLVKHELALLSFPKRTADGPLATSVSPIEWFALSSRLDAVKAQRAAALAMDFVDNAASIKTLNLAHGVPLFAKTREATYGSQSKINKMLYDNVKELNQLGPAPVAAYPPGATEFLQNVADQNQLIGFGKASVDQAAAQVFAQADQQLNR